MRHDSAAACVCDYFIYFNPRASHEARHILGIFLDCPEDFNPRASHKARQVLQMERQRLEHISIHVPRMRHDPVYSHRNQQPQHFNPRASHEARRYTSPNINLCEDISIHVPRMRHGTTDRRRAGLHRHQISIHVPRMRHDAAVVGDFNVNRHFNPRASHEARLQTLQFLPVISFISIHVPRMRHDRL